MKGAALIEQAEKIILENVDNEQFGVSELAEAMHMSRSSLLRKVKEHTQLSASQFIRQVRLAKGMEMLKQNTLTVSEVSYAVGFGSVSYFIKCFREHYGYPPGEVANRMEEEEVDVVDTPTVQETKKGPPWKLLVPLAMLLLVMVIWLLPGATNEQEAPLEKSIAVLPFQNQSSDSSNLYFVNGLMESALNNLQKIEDLRVISRTSVEQYRNTDKSVPEIAAALNVNYIVEGSGQKVGDQVLLNIQLIEVSSDEPLWSEQYSRKVVDIFALQHEVARQIADAIQAVVTPAELEQIVKKPTDNLEAYDLFLQALGPFQTRQADELRKAIPLFEQAIALDPEFSLAYANIAIAYHYLDLFQVDKQYTQLVNNYADKALLYDAKSMESLIAKALYYLQTEEYRLALPHLEKALEYNPNSTAVIQLLSDFHFRHVPNTAKYLEYALKGTKLNLAANDSITNSYVYLHLGNAFIQNGFIDEALEYINKSLDNDPANPFSPYVKTLILFARDGNMERAQRELLAEWQKDSARLDILQEAAKFYYYTEDYEKAFQYYEQFANARSQYGLEMFSGEDVKIAYTYRQVGREEEAKAFFESYAAYCEEDESVYGHMSRAVNYGLEGKLEEGIKQLKTFAAQEDYNYWVLVFIDRDPVMRPLAAHPEYAGIVQQIKDGFWERQARLKEKLAREGLL